MPKLTLDQAILLTDDELHTRSDTALARFDTRKARALDEGRDLTPRENELTAADRDELGIIRDAIEVRSARRDQGDAIESRSRLIGDEIDRLISTRSAAASVPSLLVSPDNLRRHAEAIRQGQSYGAIESRAAVTVAADMGSEANWAQTSPRDPRHLIGFAGIPVRPLTGAKAQVPQFTLPTGAAGVAETIPHPEYDGVNIVDLTAVRHGRWTKVTAAVDAFDELTGLSNMHAIGIARNLDLAAVSNVQTAAGSALAYTADVAGNVRLAIGTVSANVYADVSDLVIVGRPGDLALLQDVAPANGPDAGSVTSRFAGARLYPSLAATAGFLTVFAPQAFVAFLSPLQSASQIDPTDGSNTFGSWLHATGVAMGLVGGAVMVDVAA